VESPPFEDYSPKKPLVFHIYVSLPLGKLMLLVNIIIIIIIIIISCTYFLSTFRGPPIPQQSVKFAEGIHLHSLKTIG